MGVREGVVKRRNGKEEAWERDEEWERKGVEGRGEWKTYEV